MIFRRKLLVFRGRVRYCTKRREIICINLPACFYIRDVRPDEINIKHATEDTIRNCSGNIHMDYTGTELWSDGRKYTIIQRRVKE